MKFALVVLTALVASATVESYEFPAFGEGPLHDDMMFFLNMIPVDEADEIVLQYITEEPEIFQDMLNYMVGPEFKQLVIDMEAIPEFADLVAFMESRGINAHDTINQMNKLVGIPELKKPATSYKSYKKIRGGLGGLYQDLKELINYDDFIHGYVFKLRTSPAFREFVDMLKSPAHQRYVDALYNIPGFIKLRAYCISNGVDVLLIEDVATVVLGINFPLAPTYANDQLSEDLAEFASLVFTPEIVDVLVRYVASDKEVMEALAYTQNPEFHQLIRNVEALKEYQEFVYYLHDAGLDIFTLINQIHDLFGMEPYVPPNPTYNGKYQSLVKITGGLKGLVEDVKALLPVAEIKALFEKKLKTSKPFADFIDHISSPEMQTIIDKIYSHEIFQEMRKTALEAGLDLDAIADLFHSIFGVNFPKP